ncbi:MAG: HEAT repeat domain-containing protein [Alphaproteobacteria bacterium]|nr:HEAT repeat domain-containing protein [Alphaproteobacteria bacterium]
MSALAFVSEDWFLSGLWTTSWILAFAAGVILTMLIISRIISDRKDHRDKLTKEKMAHYFHVAINFPTDLTTIDLPKLKAEELPLICTVALDILRALRGNDSDRVITMLKIWGVCPFLIESLPKLRGGKKIKALTLLSLFNNQESLNALLHHIEDKDIYVQLAAMRGLAQLGDLQHINSILVSLTKTDRTNMPLLADILRRFGEPALSALHLLAAVATAIEVRVAALKAIGNIRSPISLGPLLYLLKDNLAIIRAQAAASLGQLGDIRAIDDLIICLSDIDAAVRINATQSLGQLGNYHTLPHLINGLSDPDWWVRYRSAEAMYNSSEGGISLLLTLGGQEGVVGQTCKQYLAEKGDINA